MNCQEFKFENEFESLFMRESAIVPTDTFFCS